MPGAFRRRREAWLDQARCLPARNVRVSLLQTLRNQGEDLPTVGGGTPVENAKFIAFTFRASSSVITPRYPPPYRRHRVDGATTTVCPYDGRGTIRVTSWT